MKRLLYILPLLLVLLACGRRHTIVDCYEPLPNAGWSALDTLRYPLPEVSQAGDYAVTFGVRLQPNFPYEGIYVVLELHLTDPYAFHRDTLYVKTVKDDGLPSGKGVVLQQINVPFPDVTLLEKQKGEFRLYHIMKREVLPCVQDVGLKLRRK